MAIMNNLSQRTIHLVPMVVLLYFEKSKTRGQYVKLGQENLIQQYIRHGNNYL